MGADVPRREGPCYVLVAAGSDPRARGCSTAPAVTRLQTCSMTSRVARRRNTQKPLHQRELARHGPRGGNGRVLFRVAQAIDLSNAPKGQGCGCSMTNELTGELSPP